MPEFIAKETQSWLLVALAASVFPACGGAEAPSPSIETAEIIENLVQSGFPRDDISVTEDDMVYTGGDVHVTLQASREILAVDDSSNLEHYRTTNLIGSNIRTICIISQLNGMLSTALDMAIENYNLMQLQFSIRRYGGNSNGCDAFITAYETTGTGGSAGFPALGFPYSRMYIGTGNVQYGVDTIEHIITHELGHAIGFRHTDYFNRSISCGRNEGNEGEGNIGAILIPGTPSGASIGTSIMNSCFRASESGEFTHYDRVALRALYYPNMTISDWGYSGRRWMADFNGDGRDDFCRTIGTKDGAGSYLSCTLSTGSGLGATVQALVSDWGWDDRRWLVDFNGDGRADLCRAAGASYGPGSYLSCNLSTGSGLGATMLFPVADWGWPGRQWMADFNGDGRADLCRAAGASYGPGSYLSCNLSTGSGLGPTILSPVSDWGYSDRRWLVDFNGDGRADFCRATGNDSGAGSYLSCTLSTGSGLGTTVQAPVSDWGYVGKRWMMDSNGDGRADYCRNIGTGSGSGSYLGCSLSTGSGFGTTINTPVDEWTNATWQWIADFDGNQSQSLCRGLSDRYLVCTP